jgi:hypothetical protein
MFRVRPKGFLPILLAVAGLYAAIYIIISGMFFLQNNGLSAQQTWLTSFLCFGLPGFFAGLLMGVFFWVIFRKTRVEIPLTGDADAFRGLLEKQLFEGGFEVKREGPNTIVATRLNRLIAIQWENLISIDQGLVRIEAARNYVNLLREIVDRVQVGLPHAPRRA